MRQKQTILMSLRAPEVHTDAQAVRFISLTPFEQAALLVAQSAARKINNQQPGYAQEPRLERILSMPQGLTCYFGDATMVIVELDDRRETFLGDFVVRQVSAAYFPFVQGARVHEQTIEHWGFQRLRDLKVIFSWGDSPQLDFSLVPGASFFYAGFDSAQGHGWFQAQPISPYRLGIESAAFGYLAADEFDGRAAIRAAERWVAQKTWRWARQSFKN
jgi:hypothetical protein